MISLNHTVSDYVACPIVVFLHGFMGLSTDWDPISGPLKEQHRCIAVDLPGHGGSVGFSPESYTMQGSALAVIETLEDLEVGRSLLVGYSMGGRLALYLALRFPERFTGLFLESASPGLQSAEDRALRRASDEELASRLESEDFGMFLEDWYRQPLFASLAQDEELLRRTIESRRRNEPGELAKSLRGMGAGSQPSLWKELAGLQAPTLAIAGELDDKYAGLTQRMAAASPKISAAVVPGAGHNVHDEAPEAYMGLLQDFLENI